MFDVAVIGLGAMGSAALYHLARRGVRAIGFDQHNPPHLLGSSHGETRVIREAYFEDPVYVPLVQRAYELWFELQEFAQEPLYIRTGGLMIGDPDSGVVQGTLRSAQEHRLPHEVLDACDINQRYPGIRPANGMVGVFEPRAGIVHPERCIASHLAGARKFGAVLRPNEKVLNWEESGAGLRVQTASQEIVASRVVLTTGAWIEQYHLELGLEIERQVLLWFQPRRPELFTSIPIHLWEYAPDKYFYGFPDLGTGLKIAFHHQGTQTNVNDPRLVNAADIERMREILSRFLPEAEGDFLRGTVCLYTNTRDGHFIIDRHPEYPNVIVGSPCSGHGFKFASAIGEVLADLATDRPPRVVLDRFAIGRFGIP
jgi:sarcosine oxidase